MQDSKDKETSTDEVQTTREYKKEFRRGCGLFCVLYSEDKGRLQASQGKETSTEKSTNRERGKEFGKEISHRAWMFVMCLSVV